MLKMMESHELFGDRLQMAVGIIKSDQNPQIKFLRIGNYTRKEAVNRGAIGNTYSPE